MSKIAQFNGVGFNAIEGWRCALPRPAPHEHALVLASIKDEPDGGADAPSLTSAVRAGDQNERPARRMASGGAEQKYGEGREAGRDARRCRAIRGDRRSSTASRSDFRNVVESTGSGSRKFPCDEMLVSLLASRCARASRAEPIALVTLGNAAIATSRS